jgi:hypothetical protein
VIEEASLYADLHVETSPIAATAVWTDHIAKVSGVSLTRGGVEDLIGVSNTEPGAGTISLVGLTATILPGYWVRVRYSSNIIWAGYVQDVTVNYTFIEGTTYEVTTLTVFDWVAWIAQFQTEFIDGAWYTDIRRDDINAIAEGTPVLSRPPGGIPPAPWVYDSLTGVRTLAEILDISATTINGYWMSRLVVPTGNGAGIDDIIDLHSVTVSANVALTDGTHTGTPTNLAYYSEIEVATRTSQVSNSVTVENHWTINETDTVTTYSASDATSIAAYGSRFAAIETNTPVYQIMTYQQDNMVPNPHLSYSSDYLLSGNANLVLNRQLLTDMDTGATNFLTVGTTQPVSDAGLYVAVGRLSANTATTIFIYNGPENNGTVQSFLVRPSTQYTASAYQRGGVGQSSMTGRADIRWYDINGATISTSSGTASTVTSTAWSRKTVTATSPSTAYSAVMFSTFVFSGTNNTSNRYFSTAAQFEEGAAATAWFSGDTTDTSTDLYFWTGEPGQSGSSQVTNNLATIATDFLTANKDPFYSPFTVRLNSQSNLTATVLLDLYKSIYIWFDSHRWTATITGISHNITINPDGTTRWMIDLNIRPSAYTI